MNSGEPRRSLWIPALGAALGFLGALAAGFHAGYVGSALVVSILYSVASLVPAAPRLRRVKESACALAVIALLALSEARFLPRSVTPSEKGAYGIQYCGILVAVYSLGTLIVRLKGGGLGKPGAEGKAP